MHCLGRCMELIKPTAPFAWPVFCLPAAQRPAEKPWVFVIKSGGRPSGPIDSALLRNSEMSTREGRCAHIGLESFPKYQTPALHGGHACLVS